MGGGISQMMALDHPERVAGLVLVGTGARLRVAPTIFEGLLNDPNKAIELITRWAWAPDTPEPLVDLGRRAMLEVPPQVIHADFLACDRFNVMGRLEEIAIPALVVSGTEDRLTPPKYGRYLQEHIPQAQLMLVEGGGHMVALEQPARVAQAIETFVESL
jgi:pimeloyl-ACP methyl ester carboxylesterase